VDGLAVWEEGAEEGAIEVTVGSIWVCFCSRSLRAAIMTRVPRTGGMVTDFFFSSDNLAGLYEPIDRIGYKNPIQKVRRDRRAK